MPGMLGSTAAPLATMRFQFGSDEEEVILRRDLPKPENIRWSERNRELLIAAVKHKLISEAELLALYKVSLERLTSEGPVRAEAKNSKAPGIRYEGIGLPKTGTLSFEEIKVDLDRKQVTIDGLPVHFVPTSYVVLVLFLFKNGTPVTKKQILGTLQDAGYSPSLEALEPYIHNVRRGLGARRLYLQGKRREGYYFKKP